jgi:hypothetical protein
MFEALGIQFVMCMRRIVIRDLLGSTAFSTLLHKRHAFRKKITLPKMCLLIFSTTFVWSISHSQKKWARYDQQCTSILVFMQSNSYSCQMLVKLECYRHRFLFNKTNRRNNSPNLFWLKNDHYMFRAVPIPIIRSSLTVHLALVYVVRF